MRDDNDERTLFDYWQDSLDEMWKIALEEDSDDGSGIFSCGFGPVDEEEATVKKSKIDERLGKVLKKLDDRNSLGAIFDKMFLGFTPVLYEYEDETRNPPPTDSARPSLATKLAVSKSRSLQKKKEREKENSLHLAQSLVLRKSSFRRNSGSFRSNSSSHQSHSGSLNSLQQKKESEMEGSLHLAQSLGLRKRSFRRSSGISVDSMESF